MGVGGVPNSFTREAALLRGHHQSINDDQLRTLAYIPLSSKASLIGLKVSAFSLTHSVQWLRPCSPQDSYLTERDLNKV